MRRFWQIFSIVVAVPMVILSVMTLLKAPEISSIEQQLSEVEQEESAEESSGEKLHVDFGESEKMLAMMSENIVPYLSGSTKYAAKPKPIIPATGGYGVCKAGQTKVLAIGDSVMNGATNAIRSAVPGVCVDAAGSRKWDEAVTRMRAYERLHGELPPVIVVGLITNYLSPAEVTSYMNATLGEGGPDRLYVFVTGYCGSDACGGGASRVPQNNAVHAFAAAHANVRVADWYALASNDWSLMYGDHIHLTPAGRTAYASIMRGAIGNL